MNRGTLRVALAVFGVLAVAIIAAWRTDSSEAVFGFLGVLVGAGVAIIIEQLRSLEARRDRRKEWRLQALTRLEAAYRKLEYAFAPVAIWRDNELEAGNGYPLMPDGDKRMSEFAHALLELRMAEGTFLGDNLLQAAKAFRESTHAVATFELPDPTDPSALAELNASHAERIEAGEKLTDLLHRATEKTAGE